MKLLVTGSSGLVGRELSALLRREGHEVIAYDLRPLDGAASRDIRNIAALREAVEGCDGVFHLAAVSRVAWGEEAPDICHDVNVACTQSLVEIMLEHGAPWLVFASSREVYGDPPSKLVTERDPVAPVNHYGRSKAEAEECVERGRSAGLRAAIVRLSNVYGTMNDHPDRAVPALLWRALSGEPIELTGGDNYFDFVHVDDSVRGLVAAGALQASGLAQVPTVHLSTGTATSLNQLAQVAIDLCATSCEIRLLPRRDYDVAGFCGDPSFAGQVLNWQPKITLREGMTRLREQMIARGSPILPAVRPGPFVPAGR